MLFTRAEYCDMMLLYGGLGQNALAASAEYAVRFPNRRRPTPGVILRLMHRLRETGNVIPNRRFDAVGRARFARIPVFEEYVLNHVADNPTTSIRSIARTCNRSYSTIQRILADEGQHAFHYTRVQALKPEDYPRRVAFCRWLLRQNRLDPDFSKKILFTDESTFGREGTFNYHNNHYWSSENPHQKAVHYFQNRFSINLWAAIVNNVLVNKFP